MSKETVDLSQVQVKLVKYWQQGKVREALKLLKQVPQDIVLEVLVVVADEVPDGRRVQLLEALGLSSSSDGDVFNLLGI